MTKTEFFRRDRDGLSVWSKAKPPMILVPVVGAPTLRGFRGENEMRRHIKRPLAVRSRAKRRQASKLAEIREALVAAGFDTVRKQATALGVTPPTAWALLNRDKRTGPSAKIIKRILSSRNLPASVRRRVEEYIEEKIDGVYGHKEDRRRWFRDQFSYLYANENQT